MCLLLLFMLLTSSYAYDSQWLLNDGMDKFGYTMSTTTTGGNCTVVIGSTVGARIYTLGKKPNEFISPQYINNVPGSIIASSNNFIFFGYPDYDNSRGAVFVYTSSATTTTTTWIQTQKFIPPSTTISYFGSSISVSNTTLMVGSPMDNLYGLVYVYTLQDPSTWIYDSTLVPPSPTTVGEQFGAAVSVYGTSAMVGIPNYPQSGAIAIYTNQQQQWTLQSVIIPSPDDPITKYGSVLTLSRKFAFFGVPTFSGNHGKVEIWESTFPAGVTTWNKKTELSSPEADDGGSNAETARLFGSSVAVSKEGASVGTVVVVGEPGTLKSGLVYVYVLDDGEFFLQKTLSNPYFNSSLSILFHDDFGSSVAVACNDDADVLVGSPSLFSVTVHTVLCPVGLYGLTCAEACSCPPTGVCDGGREGNGTCQYCNAAYYGPNCTQTCVCSANGTCDNGVASGTGECLSCSATSYGLRCDRPCDCPNGTCDSGVNGTGRCVACNLGLYGPNCSFPCPCQHGVCNGTVDPEPPGCLSCHLGYYGRLCDGRCSDNCSRCDDGVSGDGQCLECPIGNYGPACDRTCSSQCFRCNDGVAGDGACTSCAVSSTWGPQCLPCSCQAGVCDFNTGKCASCVAGYWGSDCDQPCLCKTSADVFCFDGPSGNGTCIVPPSPTPTYMPTITSPTLTPTPADQGDGNGEVVSIPKPGMSSGQDRAVRLGVALLWWSALVLVLHCY